MDAIAVGSMIGAGVGGVVAGIAAACTVVRKNLPGSDLLVQRPPASHQAADPNVAPVVQLAAADVNRFGELTRAMRDHTKMATDNFTVMVDLHRDTIELLKHNGGVLDKIHRNQTLLAAWQAGKEGRSIPALEQ